MKDGRPNGLSEVYDPEIGLKAFGYEFSTSSEMFETIKQGKTIIKETKHDKFF